ncbi:hypothetical protein C5167_025108 [Papaver somniferum]|uniref:Uncharacterized protein n=1 Tax=Papaver somniferum TaxID=3469 RepID=A0A4Y7JRJ8_PAPSO|nr:hypothetical protein C5167_025108 [Papaver somniferum]
MDSRMVEFEYQTVISMLLLLSKETVAKRKKKKKKKKREEEGLLSGDISYFTHYHLSTITLTIESIECNPSEFSPARHILFFDGSANSVSVMLLECHLSGKHYCMSILLSFIGIYGRKSCNLQNFVTNGDILIRADSNLWVQGKGFLQKVQLSCYLIYPFLFLHPDF